MDVKDKLREAIIAVVEDGHKLLPLRGRQAIVDPVSLAKTVKYLWYFGYLAYEASKVLTIEDIVNAVKKFQEWFRVDKTQEDGKLGLKTLKALQRPRCGHPDCTAKNCTGHRPEFLRLAQLQTELKQQWQKRSLNYYIKDYFPTGVFAKSYQTDVYKAAWEAWTSVAKLRVERVTKAADADILICTGQGVVDDLDGPGGILAWSLMPEGDDKQLHMKFDLDETWVESPADSGVCLFNVACHEFGHLLGLTHTRKEGALMTPFYNASVSRPQPDDDISRIQKIYGKPGRRKVVTRKAKFKQVSDQSPPEEVQMSFNGQLITYQRVR